MGFFKKKSIAHLQDTQDEWMRNYYIEVSKDFKVSDLKPFQKLIVLKTNEGDRKVVVDFSLTKNEINRLQSESLNESTIEIKTNKPFRLISDQDISLAKEGIVKKIPESEEYTIIKDLKTKNPFFEKNTAQKTIKKDEEIDENQVAKEAEKEQLNDFEAYDSEYNSSIYSEELKNQYKNKLIFEDKPLEFYDEKKDKVILTFKLRELNNDWDQYEIIEEEKFFDKSPEKQAEETREQFLGELEKSVDEVFSEVSTDQAIINEDPYLETTSSNYQDNESYVDNQNQINDHSLLNDSVDIEISQQKNEEDHQNFDSEIHQEPEDPTLFFKKNSEVPEYYKNSRTFDDGSKYPFYQKNRGLPGEYEELKVSKYTDMIIVRRKINKKLLRK